MRRRILVVAILISLIFVSSLIVRAETVTNSIAISSRVEVESLEIGLGEIAHVTGTDSFQSKVTDISLGQAPRPNQQRLLYRQTVINELEQAGVDINQVEFNIPYQFGVRSNYQSYPVNELVKAGREYIIENSPYSREELEIEAVSTPDNLEVPRGEVDFEISTNSNSLIGSALLPARVLIDDQLYRRFHLQYRVNLYTEVLVAQEDLNRGTILSSEEFAVERREITRQRSRFLDPETELEGKELTRPLQAGDILLNNMVSIPPIIERREEIDLIARVNGVIVVTVGQALENGHEDEVIEVKNKETGKRITGRVINDSQVEITAR